MDTPNKLYNCQICNKIFHNITEELFNGDEELYCSMICCEAYYNNKYKDAEYLDEEEREEEYLNKINEEEEEHEEEDDEEDELICECCKECFIPKNRLQTMCSKMCEDIQEEGHGFALINQFKKKMI